MKLFASRAVEISTDLEPLERARTEENQNLGVPNHGS